MIQVPSFFAIQEQERVISQAEAFLRSGRLLFAMVEARGQVLVDLPADPLYEA